MVNQSCKNQSLDRDKHLLELLEKEVAYYQSILELSQLEQRKLQLDNSLDEVLSVIRKKKILLECIEQLQIELSPLKVYWKEKPPSLGGQDDLVRQRLSHLENILKQILSLSQSNQNQFEILLNKLKNRQIPLQKNNKVISYA
ncbi:MAG: hypothetical protein K0S74_468 [Chlamydiales bacterium]|jgi:hypothetical protein|nr:hypothetical protein [Chlamydiales bacterium]